MQARYMLIDGHSVIFAREDLRRLHQKKPAEARRILAESTQRLHDSGQWLVTLVFDGTYGTATMRAKNTIVIAYSTADETADSMIERTVHGSGKAAQILVITADEEERRTVESLGAATASPEWLMSEMEMSERELQQSLRTIHKKSRW
ncbi:MAG: NYN domain-containing protein [Candidatus Methylacidiphilales bacterium]|nr:NYN domain-containing protein [Candidatus Methylacidiphilales bacterium]